MIELLRFVFLYFFFLFCGFTETILNNKNLCCYSSYGKKFNSIKNFYYSEKKKKLDTKLYIIK